MARVDARFATRDPGLAEWADPHPDRQPRDDEYSRLSNPGKWRILVARADAWIAALVEAGLATAERSAADAIVWVERPAAGVTSVVRVVPEAPGALPMVVARSRIEGLDDAGLTLGVGEPATVLDRYPDCGCDACDSGSQDELDRVDWGFRAVVSGTFRRLTRDSTTITAGVEPGLSWGTSGINARHPGRAEVEAALADPAGWREVSGAAWI